MQLKKNPRLEINYYRGLFFNLSLCFSLSLTLMAFEWRVADFEQVGSSRQIFDKKSQIIDYQLIIEKQIESEILIQTDLDVK
jgi:hypothetical protein